MKPFIQKFIAFCLLALVLLGTGRVWYLSKGGFMINRLIFPLPLSKVPDPNIESVRPVLDQAFYYLGRGRQCYAFVSEDEKYVLKIPRFDRYKLPFRWKVVHLPLLDAMKKEIYEDRQRRLKFTLESFRIAYEVMPKQTAMLYLHFEQTEGLPQSCRIIDRLGRTHRLDLNRTAFALQEKKDLLLPVFQRALRKGDRNKADQVLKAFAAALKMRAKLGVFNKDPSFLRNFGWDGRQCIQIDVGSFYRIPQLSSKEAYDLSLAYSVRPIREWLSSLDEEMYQRFNAHLEAE